MKRGRASRGYGRATGRSRPGVDIFRAEGRYLESVECFRLQRPEDGRSADCSLPPPPINFKPYGCRSLWRARRSLLSCPAKHQSMASVLTKTYHGRRQPVRLTQHSSRSAPSKDRPQLGIFSFPTSEICASNFATDRSMSICDDERGDECPRVPQMPRGCTNFSSIPNLFARQLDWSWTARRLYASNDEVALLSCSQAQETRFGIKMERSPCRSS